MRAASKMHIEEKIIFLELYFLLNSPRLTNEKKTKAINSVSVMADTAHTVTLDDEIASEPEINVPKYIFCFNNMYAHNSTIASQDKAGIIQIEFIPNQGIR